MNESMNVQSISRTAHPPLKNMRKLKLKLVHLVFSWTGQWIGELRAGVSWLTKFDKD